MNMAIQEDIENMEMEIDPRSNRLSKIQDYFVSTPLRSDTHTLEGIKDANASAEKKRKEGEARVQVGGWRRRRGRLGISSRDSCSLVAMPIRGELNVLLYRSYADDHSDRTCHTLS